MADRRRSEEKFRMWHVRDRKLNKLNKSENKRTNIYLQCKMLIINKKKLITNEGICLFFVVIVYLKHHTKINTF